MRTTVVPMTESRPPKYTGFEFHRGEWLAMYCNVSYEQTQHYDASPNRVWVCNTEIVERAVSHDAVDDAIAAAREGRE